MLVVTLTLGLIVGCVPPPVPAPEPMLSPLAAPAAEATPATPSSTLDVSPLPLPEAVVTRAPREPGMGSLTGELERFDGTPMRGILVYAALIEERDGVRLAAVDPLLDVRAETNAQGGFWFDNLTPGEYALATQSPVGIIMPHNTDGTIVRFQVEAGSETALGRQAVGYTYPDND
ncbi:MAG: hypothetical protein R6W76_03360 [Caldilinea sp.]